MSFDFNYKAPKVIAEIGCNHMGEMDIAKELIKLAKECNSDYAKFQKRNNKLLLTKEQYEAPHPNPRNSYGDSYGAHREYLELSVEEHKELLDYCNEIGIGYSTSVWEEDSAEQIAKHLNPEFLKVPSACNNNYKMLEVLRDNYEGEVHISFGMTTQKEADEVVQFFEEKDVAASRLVIYSCTSGYPVPFEDVSLLEINRLYDKYANRVKHIGFSGHHLGIAIDIAAYTLGANWIERHFTKDRTWKGTDHAASLEPTGLRKLVRDLHAAHKSLTFKDKEILEIEEVQRQKLKYRG